MYVRHLTNKGGGGESWSELESEERLALYLFTNYFNVKSIDS